MIDLDMRVEVIPPARERSFGARDLGKYKRHGGAGYSYGGVGSLDIIANLHSWVLEQYHKTARTVIHRELGPDETKYAIEVDGIPNAPIESAQLEGSGIIAAPFGDVKALRKAYDAAMRIISSINSKFKRPTGTYSGAMVIRLNGRELDSGMTDALWQTVTTKSNIQIFSRARHASPIESIKRGALLLAARNAADRAGGASVRASFTYRSPEKFGQRKVVSMTGRGATAKGAQFTPLAVPVLEMGMFGSNVTDYIGNIEFNLERGRKRSKKNLIERKILPGDEAGKKKTRWIDKRPRHVPPGSR